MRLLRQPLEESQASRKPPARKPPRTAGRTFTAGGNVNLIRALTLRQLQIFVIASRLPSFARAAEELHLSQPAVSMQIRQLEEALGLPLFERISRRLTLTEAGAHLLHHPSRILREIKGIGGQQT